MASLQPTVPSTPGNLGGPTTGLAALKYAAQADVFQDDPNFYAWLEDWIGKQDEEAVMIDAFNTLNDYGMQYEFQQQQQQQQEHQQSDDPQHQLQVVEPDQDHFQRAPGAAAVPGACSMDTAMSGPSPAPTFEPFPPGSTPPSTGTPTYQFCGQEPVAQPLAQQPLHAPSDNGSSGNTSSSPSVVSLPCSLPSGDNSTSFTATDSSSNSLGAPASLTPPMYPSLAAAAAAASAKTPGTSAGAATPFLATLGGHSPAAKAPQQAGGPGASRDPVAGSAFTQALSRGLDTVMGLPSELQSLFRRDRQTSNSGSSGLLDPPPQPSALPAGPIGGGRVAASHGTVSSYGGLPPPPPRPGPGLGGHANTTSLTAEQARTAPLAGGLLSSTGVGVPSLEQLIVRAICGNGNNLGKGASGGALGLWGLGAPRSSDVGLGSAAAAATGSAGAASGQRRSSGAGMGVGAASGPGSGLGLGLGGGFSDLLMGSLGGSGERLGLAGDMTRDSSGSCVDAVMAGADGGCGQGDGSPFSGSLLRTLLGTSSAGAIGSSGATAAAAGGGGGNPSHRPRRKSSSAALTHGSHGSGHHHHVPGGGIPVSHAHGHGHVGKVAVAGLARGGGGAAAAGGGAAGGRMTRSARAKAVFAALEAEVAEKRGELDSLQRENASLTQRVEILEVAVERQNAVLSLLHAARSGAGAAGLAGAGAAGVVPRPPQLLAGAGGSLPVSREAVGLMNVVAQALGEAAPAESGQSAAGGSGTGPAEGVAAERTASDGSFASGPSGSAGSAGPSQLSPVEVLSAVPGTPAGVELLEWARKSTPDTFKTWYKEHLQSLSLALLALEDSPNNPAAETHLMQLVAACWIRSTLTSVFQPLTMLRLKGLNLETDVYAEPPEQHWMEVIKFMTVSSEQIAGMENLFHSYSLLHDSFRAELQDTQRDLAELVARQQSGQLASKRICTDEGLSFMLQQTALLKRVRNILQKTHLLYSCTIGVAALRILKPKEFAKCCVQSYPFYPCGPSLMKACVQMRAMKAIWGVGACGC